MAKNDMPVIIYKILKYLYECMKAGKQPDEMDFCAESKLISIPPLYWNCVIREMYDNGFVRGVSVLITKDGPLIILDSDFNITLKGVEFLEDNTLMQKVSLTYPPKAVHWSSYGQWTTLLGDIRRPRI